MLILLVLVTIPFWIFLILLWYVKQFRYIRAFKRIPGPTPWPIVGNALEFTSLNDVIPKMVEWKQKYGNLYRMIIGYVPPNLIICDYKFVEFLLSSNVVLGKSLIYNFVHRWLGKGLLTSTGIHWKKHRKIITPAFHFKILENFIDVFEKNSNILIKTLENEVNSKSFDVYPYIKLMALDIICETALGTEINAQLDKESKYASSVEDLCSLVIKRGINIVYKLEFLYQRTNLYKQELQALDVLHSTTQSVIKNKKAKMGNSSVTDETENEYGIKKKLAFLDLLLQSTIDGRPLSDAELQDEVSTFMFAGHDTTASAISFVLYNLSLYPDIQNKVVMEQKLIFSDNFDRTCSYSDLNEMKYLEAVIKESLRLFPSVPMIGRMHDEDIEFDGIKIPAGTPLIIFIYGLMRDPKHFPEPEKFNPNRFLVKGEGNHSPFSYIPFSAGPRNCLGQKFAMLEMKSAISKVIRRYELLPADPVHELLLSLEITLRSSNGIKIRIRERKQ
ncbi:cytochrome P450 4d2 isoform X2 [Agrilus planipennis]|uniref:Cytochrome P450 4d2 isoform X1 n=1 Tax=Agrilus planipennis TaxID=224129 RepID=A0A7F5R662_AGRPL|nr:cytochrome P450 4d2 isoform X1 [Agrilus planipennis]XP_025831453.1 cytochrome P450 4d2 isoform X2 [Agrilus planipennis]